MLDVVGARAALEAADVVVVTGHGGPSLAYADVVLPAAVQHERSGTVTNIEGRVTAVTPKIVAPGSAWPDVAIAVGAGGRAADQNIGLTSVEQAAKASKRRRAIRRSSCCNDSTSDGSVVGRPSPTASSARPLDPMAFPGIQAINTVGLGANALAHLIEATPAHAPSPAHATLEEIDAGRSVAVPHYDAYSSRVNVSRRLYDNGIAVQGSPALANLDGARRPTSTTSTSIAWDVATGDPVRRARSEGSPHTARHALDEQTPRGTLEVVFGSLDESDDDEPVRALVDPGGAITQVKLATT